MCGEPQRRGFHCLTTSLCGDASMTHQASPAVAKPDTKHPLRLKSQGGCEARLYSGANAAFA